MKAPEYLEGDDEWGLPRRPPNFILDTPDDIAERHNKAVALMANVFAAVSRVVGQEAARELWHATANNVGVQARGPGRPPGRVLPSSDRYLLALYDAAVLLHGKKKDIPRKIGDFLKTAYPSEFIVEDPYFNVEPKSFKKAESESITSRLRMLLRERKEEREALKESADGSSTLVGDAMRPINPTTDERGE